MTHVTEQTFEDYVVSQLEAEHGADVVHQQFYFPSGRYADILVVGPQWMGFAYELENGGGSVLNGAGQARYYAQEAQTIDGFQNIVPVLAVPEDHIDDRERTIIQQSGVLVREMAFPDDA